MAKRTSMGLSHTAAVLLAAVSAVSASENPYEYDVSAFVRADTNGAAYRELASFPLTLDEPAALALTPQGGIAVAGAREVVILDGKGVETSRFSIEFPAQCAAFSSSGELLIGFRDHVQELDATGGVRSAWVTLGQKAVLTSVAVGGGRVYVADAGNRVVWRFDESGRMLGKIGGDEDDNAPKFIVPSPNFDVAADASRVWIVNPGRQRVEQYSHEGARSGEWGKSGMRMDAFCGCCNPIHIAQLGPDRFVTGEKGLPRVKVYDAAGKMVAVVAAPAAFGADGRKFSSRTEIRDLAVDSTGRVLVLDRIQNTIRVFTVSVP